MPAQDGFDPSNSAPTFPRGMPPPVAGGNAMLQACIRSYVHRVLVVLGAAHFSSIMSYDYVLML